MYDLVIIGSGPAGLSAAVYAKRACLDLVLLEKEPMGGGQIIYTEQVDNYLGLPETNGFDLSQKFEQHAKELGAPTKTGEVASVEPVDHDWKVVLASGEELLAKTVLLATGAGHRTLGVPGEKELTGAGVSYCATCDGAFFRNKTVAVVGGGDVALEDALYLAKGCEKVYLIHRRKELRGAKIHGGYRDSWGQQGRECYPCGQRQGRREGTCAGWNFHCRWHESADGVCCRDARLGQRLCAGR